ncbi:FCD domain-containing protein [uncultured Paracoccus sp.]|uniref:FCD domain-containing protein n=1 Tax=uncultured Paracoccus sp. TaxID=189685 RepID=UPI0025F1AC78|nr:FCD domain-containing protein [uncultured Paracoccus sp.]
MPTEAISHSDPTILLDQFEALAEISALCATLAARRAPVAQMRALEDLVARMATVDPHAFRLASFDLHDRICHLTKNSEICALAAALRHRLAPLWPVWPVAGIWRQRAMHEYGALADAINDRDESQAALVMRGHLRALGRDVLFTQGLCPTDRV